MSALPVMTVPGRSPVAESTRFTPQSEHDPSIPALDDAQHRHWLATCDGPTHDVAFRYLRDVALHTGDAAAAADAAAFASNPTTCFEEFATIVCRHLEQWLLFSPEDPGHLEGYPFPVEAPGERARDWWTELAMLDTGDALAVSLRWWQRIWVLRRAFVVAEPVDWARMYRRFTGSDNHSRKVLASLIAMLRYRSLPEERARVLVEPAEAQEALLGGWDRPWHLLRCEVPERSTREQARQALATMWVDPDEQPERAAALAQVRLAVLSAYLSEGPESLFADVDDRLALLTPDDLRALIAQSGRCISQSVQGWISNAYWPTFGARDAGRSMALTLAPLDLDLAEPHLHCPAPSHRLALVLNPFTPDEVAQRAIAVGLEETEERRARLKGRWAEANPVVQRWWRALMAVRGWYPARDVQAGMQQVSAWMLQDRDPLEHWLRPLAVYASAPDGLRAMSTAQLAMFDALLADRAARSPMPWPRGSGRGDPYAAAVTPSMLRQLLAATGWTSSGLLVDPAVLAVLDQLPVELRVEAARRGDDVLLQHLSIDPEPRVRQFAARNRRASVATLDLLLADRDPKVRSQVARNAGVTAGHLTRMSSDSDRVVARAASRALLRRLAAA
jgi:hypothetical protein